MSRFWILFLDFYALSNCSQFISHNKKLNQLLIFILYIYILYVVENPELVKPVITTVDGKKLTTEFVLLEIAAIERKISTEIESERCIPIINKVYKNINIWFNYNLYIYIILWNMEIWKVSDENFSCIIYIHICACVHAHKYHYVFL